MRTWTRMTSPVLVALLSGLALAACSGGTQSVDLEEPSAEPDEGDPFAEEAGDESAEAEEEPEPAEPVRGGGGRLKVLIKVSGAAGTGSLRILTADVEPRIIDEGPASKTYDVPAGRYDVEVTLHDTLDRPEKRLRDVPVKAGGTTEREVNFIVGQITLQPVRGRSKVGTDIRWRYSGGTEWFEQGSRAGEEIILSAGRYDAEVLVGRTKITIRDIQVYEGRRSVYPEVSMR